MKKESCIVKHESICFSLERCGMRIHVSFRAAFLEWLDEICIALGFKLFPCCETLCFLDSHGGFGFYHSLCCTFPRASG